MKTWFDCWDLEHTFNTTKMISILDNNNIYGPLYNINLGILPFPKISIFFNLSKIELFQFLANIFNAL